MIGHDYLCMYVAVALLPDVDECLCSLVNSSIQHMVPSPHSLLYEILSWRAFMVQE